jgi:hypothetical protein
MGDLRKAGTTPLSAADSHQEHVGKSNYNCFQALDPRGRTFSTGKRELSLDLGAPDIASKSPRLDSINALFDQMRAHEDKLKNVEAVLDDTAKICDKAFLEAQGGIGKCFQQLITVAGLFLSHQTGLSSAVIDSCKLPAPQQTDQTANILTRASKKTPTSEEIKLKG